MKLKYYEKLIIAIIIFIGVCILTAFIIGTYVNRKNNREVTNDNSLILSNVNSFLSSSSISSN
jgi:uncharacterized protein YneF (UPF0154 family)